MNDSNNSSSPNTTNLLKREPVIATATTLLILWSLLIGLSLYLNLVNLRKEVTNLATAEAMANWNKDQAFRGWATRHGGVYVKPDTRTPPSPYLAHLPKRDLVTSDGTKLTLLNPAFMMRQMTKEYEEIYGVKGNITAKELLNPDNAPDEWEKKALDDFDRGIQEIAEETTINGDPYVRYMKPMITVEGCGKCHGHQGFKIGDIHGGVSVSIPLRPYLAAAATTSNSIKISHAGVWFLGCLGIFGFSWAAYTRDRERHTLQQALSDSHDMLEERIIERTQTLKVKEKQLLDSQARAHYANKMASLGEMASGIAHEINSPLQAILLTVFRVKNSEVKIDSAEVSESMDMIESSITKITAIIESLRNMSRDSINDPFVTVAIKDIIRDATGITTERYKTRKIAFNIHYHDDSETSLLSCQRLQIAQVIINLLNNAFDAVMGSEDKWINLDVYETSGTIDISVTDSGAGVPVKIQDRIFEPLYTSKNIGQGTGLGLSISSEIIRNHEGTLTLDIQSANTRFVLSVPKARPS